MFEIKDNIFYVGVLNPSLRNFDITVKAKYGTSYNSYLIKDKSNILIDTVHQDYFDEFISNITEIMPIEKIDYLILNHTEPDHSGCVKKLLELNKNIKVISTFAASRNVQNIANENIDIHIVKDDEVLNIGSKTLKFILAPFLHWPDTMFTYVKEDNIVFTCDFLGSHYAEPMIFDTNIKYIKEFEAEFENYFNGIFYPFKEYVLKGLQKLQTLSYNTIAPSHGPVLTKNLSNYIEKYKNWSTIEKSKQITIAYVSAYGYTEELAQVAKNYIEENSGFEVKYINVNENNILEVKQEIDKSQAIMIGSPTINRDAVKYIWDVLSNIGVFTNKGKIAGVFGSYGWSGEATQMIKTRLTSLGLKVVDDGIKVNFKPDQDDIIKIKEYTKKILESINKFIM